MTTLNMMHLRPIISFLVFFILIFPFTSTAQADSAVSEINNISRIRIAVVAPFYLDSAFNNYEYKLGNLSIPKYFLTGLEFYNGVMMAVDSLQKEGADFDLWIFDTKKKGITADSLANLIATLNCSLIIASFSNPTEQKIFSDVSVRKNIPVISATYPNDAYLNANPFFVMINSSLKTHIEAIYKHVQIYYPLGKFIFVTRQGALENKIQTMFAEVGKKTYPLKYKSVEMPDSFTSSELIPLLDSNQQNVIICGSVNETFGTTLLNALNAAPRSYTIVAVGMPTWDGLKTVNTCTNPNLDIVYSTPYNYPNTDKTIAELATRYRAKLNGRPSDMFFKGFEAMYCFSKLMLKYHNDFLNNLSDNSVLIYSRYNFQPVKINDTTDVPDYIENKKLYFIDVSQGKAKAVY